MGRPPKSYTAFLVTHNPDNRDWEPWDDLPEDVAKVAAGKRVTGRWRFYNASVQPGDRLFWLRQHRRPQGVFASGRATAGRTSDGYVHYELEALVDPDVEGVLPVSELKHGPLNKVVWGTNRSGIGIAPEAVHPLERAWARHLRKLGYAAEAGASRSDAGATRRLIERLFGQGVRREDTAGALARSISAAHTAAEESWMVTLSEKRVRLNVGMPYMLDIEDDGFRLVVQDSPKCERVGRQFGQHVQQLPHRFMRAPGAVVYAGRTAIFARFYEAMWPYHASAIRGAAAKQRTSPHHGHAPSVLQFLRELGHAVPDINSPGRVVEPRHHKLEDKDVPPFNPNSLEDGRRRILMAVAQRQGQGDFRRALLEAYEYRCALTGCTVEAVLEAAHIVPYRGPSTNHVRNGLLLRADIHTLFDLGQLSLETNFTVRVSSHLRNSDYAQYDGARIRLPRRKDLKPDPVALERRRSLLNGHS